MGNCHRRRREEAEAAEGWEVLREEEEEAAEGWRAAPPQAAPPQAAPPLVAQLDALTSLRQLPSRRRPGRAPPSSRAAAPSALRYRFGCRWHYLHAMRVQASQMGPMQPTVRFAFLALRCLARKQHREDRQILSYLKQLRGA